MRLLSLDLCLGTIGLIPFVFYYGMSTLKTIRPFIHFISGCFVIYWNGRLDIWSNYSTITTGTVITFTINPFCFNSGTFFLNERIIWQRWIVTIIAFIGIVVTLNVHSQDFNLNVLVFCCFAVCFAVLDIFNKRNCYSRINDKYAFLFCHHNSFDITTFRLS